MKFLHQAGFTQSRLADDQHQLALAMPRARGAEFALARGWGGCRRKAAHSNQPRATAAHSIMDLNRPSRSEFFMASKLHQQLTLRG
jgi:hypothetical protein